MRPLFRGIIVLFITFLLVSFIYIIFLNKKENEETIDTTPPIIESITGNINATSGKITNIEVEFSDNENVTDATIYYKSANSNDWKSAPILSGSYSIEIPSDSINNLYYYVTVDDASGNGPIGSPSNDGSKYYIITVKEETIELVHNVFIEDGTGDWCSNCPVVTDIIHELYSSGNYNLYYVSMLCCDNEKSKARLQNEYNILGYPTVFIDGGYDVLMGSNIEKSVYEDSISKAAKRQVPAISLNVTSELYEEGKEFDTIVTIKNYENDTYSGRLKVYLTEINSIPYYGGKGIYHYGFLDFIIDEDVSISGKNQSIITETYDVSNLDVDNLMVIAVVFNSQSVEKYSDPDTKEHKFNAHYADAADATLIVEKGNLPPTVGITSPIEGRFHLFGQKIELPGPIISKLIGGAHFVFDNAILLGRTKITAQASDDSKVVKVEFYIDGKLVKEFTEEPYEYLWKTPSWIKLKHEIKVIAYDDEGKSSKPATLDVIAFILL